VAISKGVNSYATVDEAELYFEDRLDIAAWTEATAQQKAQSLVTATTLLDQMKWLGRVSDGDQALAFPRCGEYLDPRLGFTVSLDSQPATERVRKACMELAYHLLNNDGMLDDTGGLQSLEISGIKLTDIRQTQKVPGVVRGHISPMLLGGGSRQVWRAN